MRPIVAIKSNFWTACPVAVDKCEDFLRKRWLCYLTSAYSYFFLLLHSLLLWWLNSWAGNNQKKVSRRGHTHVQRLSSWKSTTAPLFMEKYDLGERFPDNAEDMLRQFSQSPRSPLFLYKVMILAPHMSLNIQAPKFTQTFPDLPDAVSTAVTLTGPDNTQSITRRYKNPTTTNHLNVNL